jgi:hypothetical protein
MSHTSRGYAIYNTEADFLPRRPFRVRSSSSRPSYRKDTHPARLIKRPNAAAQNRPPRALYFENKNKNNNVSTIVTEAFVCSYVGRRKSSYQTPGPAGQTELCSYSLYAMSEAEIKGSFLNKVMIPAAIRCLKERDALQHGRANTTPNTV